MLPKYTIEFSAQFKRHAPANHYSTDDPVALEEFIEELFIRRANQLRARNERPFFCGDAPNSSMLVVAA